MNNATPRNAARIVNSRSLSLLEQLIAAAEGAPLPAPAAACPELAAGGEHCTGNGSTPSAYLAPEQTFEDYSTSCPDGFLATRIYYRRCR